MAFANLVDPRTVSVAPPLAALPDPTVSFLALVPAADATRFTLRVNNGGVPAPKATLVGQKIMIEVSAFG